MTAYDASVTARNPTMRVCLLDLETPMTAIPDPTTDSARGHGLLRLGLQRLGYAPDVIEHLHRDALGKPRLPAPLNISLSHCPGRVLCVLSVHGPVGVDVEAATPFRAADFRLYLSTDERAWVGDDAMRFLSVWTRKEAVSKAAGSGGLRRFPRMQAHRARVQLDGQIWHTVPLPLGPGFVGHLACPIPAPQLDHLRIAPETLL